MLRRLKPHREIALRDGEQLDNSIKSLCNSELQEHAGRAAGLPVRSPEAAYAAPVSSRICVVLDSATVPARCAV
jgi:hypothetical protein